MSQINRVLANFMQLHGTFQRLLPELGWMGNQMVEKVGNCYRDKVGQQREQSGINFGTAALCVLTGGVAMFTGRIDAPSTITVTTKVGEGFSSINQGRITGSDGSMRSAETGREKTSDLKRNFSETMQQFTDTVKRTQDAYNNMYRGMR